MFERTAEAVKITCEVPKNWFLQLAFTNLELVYQNFRMKNIIAYEFVSINIGEVVALWLKMNKESLMFPLQFT
jgi:hypothetical protein